MNQMMTGMMKMTTNKQLVNKIRTLISDDGWFNKLRPFLEDPKFEDIINHLKLETENGKQVLPYDVDCFNAFKYCPYDKVKVVIIGQEPSNNIIFSKPESDGLAWSYTPNGENDFYIPKSTRNIIKEVNKTIYNTTTDNMMIEDPNLRRWAEQGILLLNSSLTSIHKRYGEHIQLWKPFINYVIQVINDYNPGTIFILWGYNARVHYKDLINERINYIFEAPYPESGAFEGCDHFRKINEILLLNNGKDSQIEW